MKVGKYGDNAWYDNPDYEFNSMTRDYFQLDFKEYRTPLDSLSLVFSPVEGGVLMSEQDLYTVTVLSISIVNYEIISGDFFARNCPYLRELYVAIDYLTDEQGKQLKQKGVTVMEGAFKNLKHLEILKLRIRPPCVKIENFLLPFQTTGSYYNPPAVPMSGGVISTTPRLKTLALISYGNGCDLSSVKIANVNSLTVLYLVSLSKNTGVPSPEYVPPGFSTESGGEREDEHLFPRGLEKLVIRVPSYLEMMCDLYRKLGSSKSSRREDSTVTMTSLSILESAKYTLPAECNGMFDAFVFSGKYNNSKTNNHTLTRKESHLIIQPCSMMGLRPIFNNALWNGLVNRNWKRNWERLELVGTVSPDKPSYTFPPTATDISVWLRYREGYTQPHPCTVHLSSICLFHSCSPIAISGDGRFSGSIDVRLTDSMEAEIEHVHGVRNYSRSIVKELEDMTFVDINLAEDISTAILERYSPKLEYLTWDNSNVDVASVFSNKFGAPTPPVSPQSAGRSTGDHYGEVSPCAEITSKKEEKFKLHYLSVVERDGGSWQGIEASFCKYPRISHLTLYSQSLLAIMPGSFASVPLKELNIKPVLDSYGDHIWPTNTHYPEHHVVVSGGLFGHEESLGAHISIGDIPIRNVSEKLCAKNREEDWYFDEVEFRNVSLVDFNFRSLCSPICNETDSALGYCDGVRNIDLSFNNLNSISLNWANVFKIPSVLQQMGRGELETNTLKANNNQLKTLNVKNDLLPFHSSNGNVLKDEHANYAKRNLSLLYSRYDGNVKKFESDYEKPMASCMQLVLDFSNNNLQTLRARSFSDMRSISKLFLRNNGVEAIEPGFVSGKSCFSHGCVIDMSGNRMGIKWAQMVGNLTKHIETIKTPIKGLFLRNNIFVDFPYGVSAVFAYYRNIWNNASLGDSYATLDLSHNNISSIDGSICSGLGHVGGPFVLYVNLASNKLKYVSDDAFHCPPNVQLLVNMNNNIDLIRLPENPQLLGSLHLLSVLNTRISSKTLPCAYQLGSDVEVPLESLVFAPSAWFSSEATLSRNKMMECWSLYRLRRNYLTLQNINPDLMENAGAEGLVRALREKKDGMFANLNKYGKTLKCVFTKSNIEESNSGDVMDFDSFNGSTSCGICEDKGVHHVIDPGWYNTLWSWIFFGLVYCLLCITLSVYLFFVKPKIWEIKFMATSFLYGMVMVKEQFPSKGATKEGKTGITGILLCSNFESHKGSQNSSIYPSHFRENESTDQSDNYDSVVDALTKGEAEGYCGPGYCGDECYSADYYASLECEGDYAVFKDEGMISPVAPLYKVTLVS
eukprot:Nk52_evm21s348 gene=Nk52_evmTU21s348